MNWIEEALQVPGLTSGGKPYLRDWVLDTRGRIRFRVDYSSGGASPAHVVICVLCVARGSFSSREAWISVQRYEVGNPREHTRETRAALVRMYTELFEDRCEQTGIPCVNERRKEMKRWMESSKSTDSQ